MQPLGGDDLHPAAEERFEVGDEATGEEERPPRAGLHEQVEVATGRGGVARARAEHTHPPGAVPGRHRPDGFAVLFEERVHAALYRAFRARVLTP